MKIVEGTKEVFFEVQRDPNVKVYCQRWKAARSDFHFLVFSLKDRSEKKDQRFEELLDQVVEENGRQVLRQEAAQEMWDLLRVNPSSNLDTVLVYNGEWGIYPCDIEKFVKEKLRDGQENYPNRSPA